MTALHWMLLLVVAQRLGELMIAKRNTRRLLADGAIEHGARHYPLIVILHASWIACLFIFVPADRAAHWGLIALFLLLQAGRIWVIGSLGRHWTTRVITLPGHPLVRRGPYRWINHPNYVIVASEILILPLAFGAWEIAVIFSILNAAILYHRINVENRALAGVEHRP